MKGVLFLTLLLLQTSQAVAAEQVDDSPVASSQNDKMSDNDRLAKAKADIANMSTLLSKVIKHLQSAREEKDTVKLNCVNEKLTKIKGLLKISEQANVSIQEAMARKDSAAVQAESTKITISQQKCMQLAADSEACVGELAVYAGDEEVEVNNDNESPYNEEQLAADTAITVEVERPVEASPYQ